MTQKSQETRTSPFPPSRFLIRDGFKLHFDVQNDHSVKAVITLDESMQGAPTLVHGGALAAILDEAMTISAFESHRMGVTANLNVDYRAPIPVETTVTVTARVDRVEGKKTFVVSTITLPDGIVAAEARGLFIFNQIMNDGLHAALEG